MINKLLYMIRRCKLRLILHSIGKNFNVEKDYRFIGAKHIEIGNDFYANTGVRMEVFCKAEATSTTPYIKVGNGVNVGQFCHIGAINGINIDDGVLMGSKVYISDHMHGNPQIFSLIPPAKRPLYSKGKIHIGKNVWLGDNVVVMPGVSIGENSIVGANSVVTKDIPDNVVAAGVPAKVIREYKIEVN